MHLKVASRRSVWSAGTVFTVLTLTFAASACSPAMFGSGEDSGVKNTASYRRVNTACAGLDLSSSQIDVKTFKKLVNCFNSNGALDKIADLVANTDENDLQSIVDVGNKYVLTSKELIYKLERTYQALDQRGILQDTLGQFGHLLDNEEFIASSIELLKEGYEAEGGSSDVSALSGDKDLLKAIEKISTKITADGVSDAIDAGLDISGAKAFSSLQDHFKQQSSPEHILALSGQLLSFMKGISDKTYFDAGRALINQLINGNLFRALDEVTGKDSEDLRQRISRMGGVLRAQLRWDPRVKNRKGLIIDDVTSLFHYAHTQISCLKGSQHVDDADMFVIRELSGQDLDKAADFIKRGQMLTLVTMNPFCTYPEQLGEFYPAMISLADTAAIEPAAELIKAFYRYDMADLLISIMSDTGSDDAAGIKLLTDTLSELTNRDAWDDLLLLVALPRIEDRGRIVDVLKFITEPVAGTDKQSIYDILTRIVSKTNPMTLARFIHSIGRFTESSDPILVPALTALRKAFYVNDVHPLIDLAVDVTGEASKNEALYRSLFKISAMPQFPQAVKQISELAANGELKELLGSVITLFHKFALQGKVDIHDGQEPAFVAKRRHDLSAHDIVSFNALAPEPSIANEACTLLDPRIPMDNYSDPKFEPQLTNYVSCINSDNKHQDVEKAIDFLRSSKTEDGRSFFDYQIDLIKTLVKSPSNPDGLDTSDIGYIGNAWIRSFDDGRFFHLLDALPYFVTRKVRGKGDSASDAGETLRPLLDLADPIMSYARENLHRLEMYGASVLRRDDIPDQLKYIEKVWDQKPEPVAHSLNNHYDIPRIMRWVGNKECRANSTEQFERTRQIIDDYENSVNNWELVGGMPRRAWTKEEFRGYLNQLFDKFADPSQSEPTRPVVQALFNTMKLFSLGPDEAPSETKHYHPEDLVHWIWDRANDYRFITFFYPGEKIPRVRLVNSLDRLEVVLVAADFDAPFPFNRNFAQQFLAQIAEAYGDEPCEVWPIELQRKYGCAKTGHQGTKGFKGKLPQKIADAVHDMRKTQDTMKILVGFPDLPGCTQYADPLDPKWLQDKETSDPISGCTVLPDFIHNLPGMQLDFMRTQLYNIEEVFDVLTDNLPGAVGPDGKPSYLAGGMRVLRDLFFQMYYSTPEKLRQSPQKAAGTKIGDKNNLTVIRKLIRMGFTRAISRQVRLYDREDPQLLDLFKALIVGGSDDNAGPLVTALVAHDKDRKVVWSALDQLFDLIDASAPVQLNPDQKKDLDARIAALKAAKTDQDAGNVISGIAGLYQSAAGGRISESRMKELRASFTDLKAQGQEDSVPVTFAAASAGWNKDLERAKQLGFYAFAQANKMELLAPTLTTIVAVLNHQDSSNNYDFLEYLGAHADKIEDLFRSQRLSWLMRALYEDTSEADKERLADLLRGAVGDPQRGIDGLTILKALDTDQCGASWDHFVNRMNAVADMQDYQLLHIGDIAKDMLHFVEGTDAAGQSAANKLRLYLALRMENQDFDQLLLLAKKDPDKLNQVLETVAHYVRDDNGGPDGELKEFFKMARRSLSTPQN